MTLTIWKLFVAGPPFHDFSFSDIIPEKWEMLYTEGMPKQILSFYDTKLFVRIKNNSTILAHSVNSDSMDIFP